MYIYIYIYIHIIYNYTHIYKYIIIYDRNLSFKQPHERVMIHFRCEHLHGDQGNKAHQWPSVQIWGVFLPSWTWTTMARSVSPNFARALANQNLPEPKETWGGVPLGYPLNHRKSPSQPPQAKTVKTISHGWWPRYFNNLSQTQKIS